MKNTLVSRYDKVYIVSLLEVGLKILIPREKSTIFD